MGNFSPSSGSFVLSFPATFLCCFVRCRRSFCRDRYFVDSTRKHIARRTRAKASRHFSARLCWYVQKENTFRNEIAQEHVQWGRIFASIMNVVEMFTRKSIKVGMISLWQGTTKTKTKIEIFFVPGYVSIYSKQLFTAENIIKLFFSERSSFNGSFVSCCCYCEFRSGRLKVRMLKTSVWNFAIRARMQSTFLPSTSKKCFSDDV